MKRLLAIAVMSVLALVGLVGTASALTPEEEALLERCEAEFDEAFLELTADLDEVEFDQLIYDIDDLFTKWEMGQITDEELLSGLDALHPGLLDIFIDFFECVGTEEPVQPGDDKPKPLPTSVPAGDSLPNTGAGLAAAIVGLGLAVAGGGILLVRRLVNNS